MKQSGLNEILNTGVVSHLPRLSVLAWVIFVVVLLVCVTMSGVLLYHWRTYGMSDRHVVFARTLYVAVALCIVLVAFVSLVLM